MSSNKCISGFFLSFPDNEFEIISGELSRAGYSPDSDGLKQFILDEFTGDAEDAPDAETNDSPPHPSIDLLRRTAEYVRDNPETLEYYKGIFGSALNKVFKK